MSFTTGSIRPQMGTRLGFNGGVAAGPMDPNLQVDPRPTRTVFSGDPRGSADASAVDVSGKGVVLGPRSTRSASIGASSSDNLRRASYVANLSDATGLPQNIVFAVLLGLGAFIAFGIAKALR